MRERLLVFFMLLPLAAPVRAEEASDARPFGAGEELLYEIRLLGIETAQAELEVFDDRGGGVRIRAKAKTTGAADGIFRMQSQATCTLEPDLDPGICRGDLKSRRTMLRREVRFEKDDGVVHERHMHNGKLREKRIPFEPGFDRVHDTLSGLYLIRANLPKVGETLEFRGVVEGGSGAVRARTLREEVVDTPFGSIPAAVVSVEMLGKAEKGATTKAQLWISLDENRLPVKAVTKAPIGSLEARLVAAKGVKADGALARR